jgi:hypothetical protein
MSVEGKIVDKSSEGIKALAPRAAKAAEKPETGIKILVAGARYVIRDCARITIDYLPLKLYGGFVDPLKTLGGLFTKKEVEALVKRGKEETCARQLCNAMLLDAYKNITENKEKVVVKELEVIESSSEPYDVYGDYGSDSFVEEEPSVVFDFDDELKVIEILCDAFKAK